MFKLELWQTHNEYRTLVTTMGRKLSRNHSKYAFDTYEKECQKLLNLNLDAITEYITLFYSSFGRSIKHQAQILRSIILFVLFFNKTSAKTSFTTWVKETLPASVPLIVLIGCACKRVLEKTILSKDAHKYRCTFKCGRIQNNVPLSNMVHGLYQKPC